MSMFDAYTGVLHQYCDFAGRTRRRVYWEFVLVNALIATAIGAIEGLLLNGSYLLGLVYTLAVLLPSLGAAVRRLHDTGRSAWWLFLMVIPLVGAVVLLVFLCLDSQPERNEWGVNPKERLFFSGE